MKKEANFPTIGQLILDRINQAGLTKSKVADDLQISRQVLNALKNRKDIPLNWLIVLRDKHGIDFINEAIKSGTATVNKLDSEELTKVFEPEKVYQAKAKTTISFNLELDEFETISIPGDISARVKEMLKQENNLK